MTDKKDRTIPEIQADYQTLCAKAGHLQYQLFIHQADLDLVNTSLKALNLEASEVQAKAATAPPAAETPAEEPAAAPEAPAEAANV